MEISIRDQIRQQLREQVAPAFRATVPLAQQRQVLDQMSGAAPLAAGVELRRGELAGLPSETLTPADAEADRAVLFLHGGGYVMGSCASHRGLAANLAAAARLTTHLPEYRLAPEHPFPAASDDAIAAYRALLDGGLTATNVAIAGDSAGGGLTLSTLLRIRDEGLPLPGAAVVLSPYADLTFSGETITTRAAVDPWINAELLEPFSAHYRGALDASDPRISPLFGDFSGLPPLLIHVGDQEILLADATRVAERARAAGVDVELEVWPEVWHVFHFFAPALPEANEALAKIGTFLRARLGPAAAR